jgi:hypothetical protein
VLRYARRVDGCPSPPPIRERRPGRWAQLPPTNRQRLLVLLSRLLERRLPQRPGSMKEDGDATDAVLD